MAYLDGPTAWETRQRTRFLYVNVPHSELVNQVNFSNRGGLKWVFWLDTLCVPVAMSTVRSVRVVSVGWDTSMISSSSARADYGYRESLTKRLWKTDV